MKGKLFGVGIGPGDPDYLTLKAVKTIKAADVIAAPGRDVKATTAYKIAVQAVPEMEKKELLPVVMPMVLDRTVMEQAHVNGAHALEYVLDQGKNIAFVTLGDPTVYSTFSYLEKIVKADGYETAYISGITSFCATAARLGRPLTEWEEPLHVIPAVHQLGEKLDLPGTYVLMKSARQMVKVKEILRNSGRQVMMAENCGLENEHLYYSVDDIPDDAGYFSLIIAKEPKED